MPDVARTNDLPPGQRFEFWKHVLSETFVPLEVSSPRGDARRSGPFCQVLHCRSSLRSANRVAMAGR